MERLHFTNAKWRAVTLGTSRTIAPPSAAPRTGVGFNDFVNCDDKRYSPQNFDGPCRVGIAQDLYWWHSIDTTRSDPLRLPVVSIGDANTTSGVFWSKVLDVDPPSTAPSWWGRAASDRDARSEKRLRDHYTFVTTPLFVVVPVIKYDPTPPWRHIKLCFGPCDPEFDISKIDRRKVVFEPLNPAGRLTSPAYLFERDGKIIGVRDSSVTSDGIDLTAAFSPSVVSLLARKDLVWARPVESRARAQTSSSGLTLSAVPRVWTGTSVVAGMQVTSNGYVDVVANHQPSNIPGKLTSTSDAPPSTSSSPSARIAAIPLLSKSERALYFVGGDDATAKTPVGDVWRFSFETSQWSRVTTDAIALEHVIAATYDVVRGKLIVLDEISKGPKISKFIRFSVIDTRTGDAREVLTLPRLGVFDQLGLSVLAEGKSYALVAQKTDSPTWSVFRFELNDKDNLRRSGNATGFGELYDVAEAVNDEVRVRVRAPAGTIDTQRVEFWPSSKGCSLL